MKKKQIIIKYKIFNKRLKIKLLKQLNQTPKILKLELNYGLILELYDYKKLIPQIQKKSDWNRPRSLNNLDES